MLSRRPITAATPSTRPLRPPNPPTPLVQRPPFPRPHLRPFSRQTPLLLVARTARPQLPYLSPPAFRAIDGGFLGPNARLARLLSTETRQYVASQVFLAAKWTAILWTFAFLLGLAYLGVQAEMEERRAPTPDEWTWWSKWSLMGIRQAVREGEASGALDWAGVGSALRRLLRRLEDPRIEGMGLGDAISGEVVEGAGEGTLVEGVGKVGLDISGKSWAWRTTYHEVLISLARAAEHLDGMVLDKTRGIVFPRAVMIGPSNPDPRPVPAYMSAAPREENCVDAFEAPETYYMRILTGRGFTTRQKLEAVAGYANWLEYKGLDQSAEEVLRWGVDIAKSGLDRNVEAEKVIDEKTFVLKPEAAGAVTENLLQSTTSLAIHLARHNDLASALPILLSVLRARRSAPLSPFPQPEPTQTESSPSSILAKVFRPPQFPSPPPSGDLSLVRSAEKPTCEESELMLYIGEILFATSPKRNDGLGWTRQGVAIAEANLQDLKSNRSTKTNLEYPSKCQQCLRTGLANWETMLRQLSPRTASVTSREGSRDAGWLEWRRWFGGEGGVKGKTLEEVREGSLDEELRKVEAVRERIVAQGIEQAMARKAGGPGLNVGMGM